MFSELLDNLKKYKIESFLLLIIFSMTWLGFGNYMAGFIVPCFLYSLFFKEKRNTIFRDRLIIILLIIFTANNVISSLLSIRVLKSTLLSLLRFIVIFIPVSYAAFSVNRKNCFLIKWIVPFSFVISFIIVLYLISLLLKDISAFGFTAEIFRRHSFPKLGTSGTPDILVMLGGIGYGYIIQRDGEKYKWLGFLYILFIIFGLILAFDRGGLIAFFIVVILLLSFDYKRLIIFFAVLGIIIYLSRHIDALSKIQKLYVYIFARVEWIQSRGYSQLAVFKVAWKMIKDHWLFGVGTNNFAKFVKYYYKRHGFSYAHNFVLQFWAENGLFGMLSALSIISLVIYRWLKSWKLYKYKYVALGIGASFIGMLV